MSLFTFFPMHKCLRAKQYCLTQRQFETGGLRLETGDVSHAKTQSRKGERGILNINLFLASWRLERSGREELCGMEKANGEKRDVTPNLSGCDPDIPQTHYYS